MCYIIRGINMSGGYWNYMDSTLKNEIFDYFDERKTNPLEDVEISELVWDVFELLHEYDWYISGDTSEERYIEEKNKFKKKWLRNKNYNKEVLKVLIEKEFESKKQELIKML
jgi:hypothetical protein